MANDGDKGGAQLPVDMAPGSGPSEAPWGDRTTELRLRVTLKEPLGHADRCTSWKVEFNGPYDNGRPPHVRLRATARHPWPEGLRPGMRFAVSRPRKKGKAVMREIEGLSVSGGNSDLAHITVHYGDKTAEVFCLLDEAPLAES